MDYNPFYPSVQTKHFAMRNINLLTEQIMIKSNLESVKEKRANYSQGPEQGYNSIKERREIRDRGHVD